MRHLTRRAAGSVGFGVSQATGVTGDFVDLGFRTGSNFRQASALPEFECDAIDFMVFEVWIGLGFGNGAGILAAPWFRSLNANRGKTPIIRV